MLKIRQSYHGSGGKEGYKFKVYNDKGKKLGKIVKFPVDCSIGDVIKLDEKLTELLNRRPNLWGKVSVKTFEKDIKLLTCTILNLQDEVEYWKSETDKHLSFYINQTLKQHEEGKNDQRN